MKFSIIRTIHQKFTQLCARVNDLEANMFSFPKESSPKNNNKNRPKKKTAEKEGKKDVNNFYYFVASLALGNSILGGINGLCHGTVCETFSL